MKKDTVTKYFLLGIVLLAIVFAIAMKATIFQKEPTPPPAPAVAESQAFRDYWFGGKAEINSYQLQQAQYGSLMPGKAVLIFVTEDFRTDTQVKSESEATRDRSAPTLKSNIIRKFVTGIYDYSLFTSVFTPINNPVFPRTLKVSTSAQEWCGHSYIQLNLRSTGYAVSGRSYFENEVAEDYTVAKVMLEDELWNRIRLAPDKLPTGSVQLVPGTQAARLRHQRLDPQTAEVALSAYSGTAFKGDSLQTYDIDYKSDKRKLSIIFENKFPYRIVGWEETYATKNKVLTSRAVLQQTIQSDYWNRNQPADSTLRRSLAIP
nr:hypothetical protein [uncultured Arsenicibacter sp.]